MGSIPLDEINYYNFRTLVTRQMRGVEFCHLSYRKIVEGETEYHNTKFTLPTFVKRRDLTLRSL